MEIVFLRIIIITIMSFLFGFERQLSHKPVGFGTFIFVSVGSCVLTLLSGVIYPKDPFIIVGGIITGIGFLGAGALVRTQDKIFGFTTAASIWIFAILGITIGLGYYLAGGITYIIIWIVILADRILELRGFGSHQRKITICTNKIIKNKNEIIRIFNNHKWRLLNIETDKENKRSQITYLLSAPRNYVSRLNNILLNEKWVYSFKIE